MGGFLSFLRELGGRSAIAIGDDDVLHLEHGLHNAVGFLAIRIAEATAESVGDDLPGDAALVLKAVAIVSPPPPAMNLFR